MKNYLLICAALILITACTEKEQANATNEKDYMLSVLAERNDAVANLNTTVKELETTLDSVLLRQQHLSLKRYNEGTFRDNPKGRIRAKLNAVNNLMGQNSKRLTELNRKLNEVYSERTMATSITYDSDRLLRKPE